MAFHQAISALNGAKNKAAGGIIGAAMRAKKAGNTPDQRSED
jgi:hypothetical protein